MHHEPTNSSYNATSVGFKTNSGLINLLLTDVWDNVYLISLPATDLTTSLANIKNRVITLRETTIDERKITGLSMAKTSGDKEYRIKYQYANSVQGLPIVEILNLGDPNLVFTNVGYANS